MPYRFKKNLKVLQKLNLQLVQVPGVETLTLSQMRLIMRSVFINPEEFSYGHLHDLYLSIMGFHLPPKPTAKPLKKKRVALSYKNSAAPLDITISPEIFNNPNWVNKESNFKKEWWDWKEYNNDFGCTIKFEKHGVSFTDPPKERNYRIAKNVQEAGEMVAGMKKKAMESLKGKSKRGKEKNRN